MNSDILFLKIDFNKWKKEIGYYKCLFNKRIPFLYVGLNINTILIFLTPKFSRLKKKELYFNSILLFVILTESFTKFKYSDDPAESITYMMEVAKWQRNVFTWLKKLCYIHYILKVRSAPKSQKMFIRFSPSPYQENATIFTNTKK